MATIKRITNRYVVTCNDISALVGYVKGIGGACAAKQAIDYLSSQMQGRDWGAVIETAVVQKKLMRYRRRLFTLAAWQSYQRTKLIKKGLTCCIVFLCLI